MVCPPEAFVFQLLVSKQLPDLIHSYLVAYPRSKVDLIAGVFIGIGLTRIDVSGDEFVTKHFLFLTNALLFPKQPIELERKPTLRC